MSSSDSDSALFTPSSAADGPAPTSPWQVFASDWVAHVQDSSGRSFASSSAFGPGGSSWRTSPVSCRLSALAPEGGSVPPLAAPPALTLFGEEPADDSAPGDDGSADTPDLGDAWHSTAGGWAPSSGGWGNAGMASPTECWTLRTSESPNDAVVSSLSDVLETRPVPPKYFLSPKACRGILARAARRGRALPGALTAALGAVANRSTP
jgi:hypothetical protein